MPSFLTSNGGVMLAALDRKDVSRILEEADRRPLTAWSATDVDALMVRIDQARAQGWAVVDEERETGTISVAAPVEDSSGRVVAAVNMPVDNQAWGLEAVLSDLSPRVRRTAEVIGRSIDSGI